MVIVSFILLYMHRSDFFSFGKETELGDISELSKSCKRCFPLVGLPFSYSHLQETYNVNVSLTQKFSGEEMTIILLTS